MKLQKLHNKKILTFIAWVEEYNENVFVAHSLETGLVATARDESDAISKMGKMLVRQIEFAVKNDRLRDIYHPAPEEIWDKFQKSKRVISRTQKTIPANTYHSLLIDQTAYASAC
jgi:hypothetical protein